MFKCWISRRKKRPIPTISAFDYLFTSFYSPFHLLLRKLLKLAQFRVYFRILPHLLQTQQSPICFSVFLCQYFQLFAKLSLHLLSYALYLLHAHLQFLLLNRSCIILLFSFPYKIFRHFRSDHRHREQGFNQVHFLFAFAQFIERLAGLGSSWPYAHPSICELLCQPLAQLFLKIVSSDYDIDATVFNCLQMIV